MKLTKMAGAFALTAAMAMTAVPAFAAVGVDNEELFTTTGNGSNATGTQTTVVEAEAVNTQLMATIPTKVAIVIPSSGTGAIVAPQASAYKITNTGTSNAIQLKSVQSTAGLFSLSTGTDNAKSLALKLDAGTWEGIALDGSLKNAQGANMVNIAANNGTLGLRLYGNANSGATPLTSDNLTSAVMTITYTIGLPA